MPDEMTIGELSEVARELLAAGNAVCFPVAGASMWPLIRTGDIAHVEPVADPGSIRTGDVVLFLRPDGRLVMHRVVRVLEQGGRRTLRIRGDSQGNAPEDVEAGRVIGRLTAIERGERRLALDRPHRRLLGLLWVSFQPLLFPAARAVRFIRRRI